MSGDPELRALQRAHAASPNDLAARKRLEVEWLRQGLGWSGDGIVSDNSGILFPTSCLHEGDCGGEHKRERGVYTWSGGQAPILSSPSPIKTQLVLVPSGEIACERHEIHGAGRRITDSCPDCRGTGRVTIAPFYLGRFPLTWGEWDRWPMRPEAIHRHRGYEEHRPAVNVTHADALAFCAWSGLRLPTAVEWLWAALGPTRCVCGHPRGSHPGTIGGKCLVCGVCRRFTRTHCFPWGDDEPTPERCAAADPRYKGKSTAPVFECGDADRHKKGDGPCRLVPARTAGAAWPGRAFADEDAPHGCGPHDMVGNVGQRVAERHVMGQGFREHRVGVVTGQWIFDGQPREWIFDGQPRDDVGFRIALSAVT